MGGRSLPFKKGGDQMTVFQALIVMIAFGSLIVSILSQIKK